MIPNDQMRARAALAAAQALHQGGDTRMLKRLLKRGNRYALAALANRGLTYQGGAIVRVLP